MLGFAAAPQSVALPINFRQDELVGRDSVEPLRFCVSQDGRLGSRIQLGGSQRQPLLDDYGLVAGVPVAVAGGRTLGLGMGPDGVGGGVGGACNFASRNFFRCRAS